MTERVLSGKSNDLLDGPNGSSGQRPIRRAVILTLCILSALSAKVSVAAFQLEPYPDKRECSTRESFLICSVHFFPPNCVWQQVASKLRNCTESITTLGIHPPQQELLLDHSSATQQRNPSADFCFNYILKIQPLVCVPL